MNKLFNEEFYKRLEAFFNHTNLGNNAFGKKIGESGAQVSYMIKSKTNFGVDKVLKIVNAFPDLNPDWLLRGAGEMILSEGNLKGKLKGNLSALSEPFQPYGKPALVTVDEGGNDNIVMVDVKAAAGYTENLQTPVFFKELPAFKLPGGRFRNGTFRGFEVENDSMQDTLFAGNWVIGRQVTDMKEILEGYIHVVVGLKEIVIKRILNRIKERNKFVLLSDNDAYRPKEIDADDVQELWLVKTYFSFDLRNRNRDIGKKVLGLEADVAEVKKRLSKIEGKRK